MILLIKIYYLKVDSLHLKVVADQYLKECPIIKIKAAIVVNI